MSRRSGALALALAALLVCPAAASAHGPVAPVASDYLATVSAAPRGLEVRIVDGDQRMWLRVPATETVVVLDYRGAPYLRFSPGGIAVNANSEMYYLNQTPVAETPPAGLTAHTPPSWQRVSGGHVDNWHDGRLHALATLALAPGASYVGRWTVPLRIDGTPALIAGALWHRGAPSIVWFWPIVVALLCLLAARRLGRPELDGRLARWLALLVLAAIALASCGRQLHGRPAISAFGVIELGVILALVAWGLVRVLFRRPGFLLFFVIAFVAIWEGITLISTLTDGYVLMAIPAFAARSATVACLAGGAGLILLAFRLAERPEPAPAAAADELGDAPDIEAVVQRP